MTLNTLPSYPAIGNPYFHQNFQAINNMDVTKLQHINNSNSIIDKNNMNKFNNLNYFNNNDDQSNQLKLWLYNNSNNNQNIQQLLLNSFSNLYRNTNNINLAESNQTGNPLISQMNNENKKMMNPNFLKNMNLFSSYVNNGNLNSNQNVNDNNFILK
jgi:hypothetical protein